MITLYTTHCPKCKMLEKKLNDSKVEYKIIDDEELMIKKGFASAPQLEVDGQIMDYTTALRWIMNGGNN